MTYVILKAPNDGYYWLVKAATAKHFELLDKNFAELESGSYMVMHDRLCELETRDYDGLIHLRSEHTVIQTTEEGLHSLLNQYPDYLNDKEFL